jgi:prophage regulatory protein
VSMSASVSEPERLIRLPELKTLTGFSATSTIYRLMSQGELPSPVKIGSRSVAWRASEIAAWQAARPVARTSAAVLPPNNSRQSAALDKTAG